MFPSKGDQKGVEHSPSPSRRSRRESKRTDFLAPYLNSELDEIQMEDESSPPPPLKSNIRNSVTLKNATHTGSSELDGVAKKQNLPIEIDMDLISSDEEGGYCGSINQVVTNAGTPAPMKVPYPRTGNAASDEKFYQKLCELREFIEKKDKFPSKRVHDFCYDIEKKRTKCNNERTEALVAIGYNFKRPMSRNKKKKTKKKINGGNAANRANDRLIVLPSSDTTKSHQRKSRTAVPISTPQGPHRNRARRSFGTRDEDDETLRDKKISKRANRTATHPKSSDKMHLQIDAMGEDSAKHGGSANTILIPGVQKMPEGAKETQKKTKSRISTARRATVGSEHSFSDMEVLKEAPPLPNFPEKMPEGTRETKKRTKSRISTARRATVGSEHSFSDMEVLKDAPPLPNFPNTGKCKWTFNAEERVILANFKCGGGQDKLSEEDESFLLSMMERTDIAVVSDGLFNHRNKSLWDADLIKGCAGNNMYHHFRLFEKTEMTQEAIDDKRFGRRTKEYETLNEGNPKLEHFCERDGDLSMKIGDYICYLTKWQEVQKNPTCDSIFKFKTFAGDDRSIDVKKSSIYLIDLDLAKFLPEINKDFKKNFLARGFLPGGKHCMMNSVNVSGRPFMGPNLYFVPPGGFTHFHQDGHGTVDSGHLCIEGYNEVIMLARMDEINKKHALHLLTCSDRRKGKDLNFDALYGLPHNDGEKPMWPDKTAIERCRHYNYYPCVFILKPGQLLHINKGRLHAFRKLSRSPLDHNDAHYDLRNRLVKDKTITVEQVCKSVAWDWMFLGANRNGVDEEISSTLKCADLLQRAGKETLAIPRRSIIELTKFHLASYSYHKNKNDRLGTTNCKRSLNILQGLYSSLRKFVLEETSPFSDTYATNEVEDFGEFEKLNINSKSDFRQYPKLISKDPAGNEYFCMLCNRELGNAYFRCKGCHEILHKDFNICLVCHRNKNTRLARFEMNSSRPLKGSGGKRSDYNHVPSNTRSLESCRCKQGPQCERCGYMICCSCKCHQEYSLHYRRYDDEMLNQFLAEMETVCNDNANDS